MYPITIPAGGKTTPINLIVSALSGVSKSHWESLYMLAQYPNIANIHIAITITIEFFILISFFVVSW